MHPHEVYRTITSKLSWITYANSSCIITQSMSSAIIWTSDLSVAYRKAHKDKHQQQFHGALMC
eukprot:TRINITY_DN2805_c0_g1_i1.p6 TRINITY_DN2805_c0_g1~~TRINITY_DN2805_c0_g1_i1.p6  ORF type:complete len:63 (-),score=10.07 TRINITY_DN2805_c0_g1_i1:36-224(-)